MSNHLPDFKFLGSETSETKPCDIKDLQIRRSDKRPTGYKQKYKHLYVESIDVDLRHKQDRSPPTKESLETFTNTLSSISSKPCVLPLLQMFHQSSQENNTDFMKPTETMKEEIIEGKSLYTQIYQVYKCFLFHGSSADFTSGRLSNCE